MSKLERLAAKPLITTLEGVELTIHPLTVDEDLQIVLSLDDPDIKVRCESFKALMRKTLKRAVPDATDEEIKNVSLKHFKPLFEAIKKVNGLDIQEEDVKG